MSLGLYVLVYNLTDDAQIHKHLIHKSSMIATALSCYFTNYMHWVAVKCHSSMLCLVYRANASLCKCCCF